MTMHKAKGLEFDTVILPTLAATTRHSDRPPLLFHQLTTADEHEPIVVAPIKAATDDNDPIFDLLWTYEQHKEDLERDRLLYVAITRARRRLHLFAPLARTADDEPRPKPPGKGSLLERLWPVAGDEITAAAAGIELPADARVDSWSREPNWAEVPLRRLPADWRLPAVTPAFSAGPAAQDTEREVEFEWAGQWAMHVGSVVHRWLQHIAEDGAESWDTARVARLGPALRRMLRHFGTAADQLDQSERRALEALTKTLDDERGRWLLSGQHGAIANEFPVITVDGDRYASNVIDRTFVDADGVRWIIDYKTGTHEGTGRGDFLASEAERYRPQLRRYRDAMAALDARPIRTALYFPLLQAFHEVDCDV
jgi:ATP-dependent exoDNAse (exonuclease V) beta subunit